MAKKSKGRGRKSVKRTVQRASIFKRIVALAVIGVVLLISLPFTAKINELLRLYTEQGTDFNGSTASEVINYGDTDTRLLVHFIDVGQGDATFIELPDGKTILIDGGKDKEKSKLLEYLNEADERSDTFNKKSDGGNGFDHVILTHADEDHCGGIDDAINEFGAKTFYRPNELATYKNFNDPNKSMLTGSYGSQSTLAYSRAITAGHTADKVVISKSGIVIDADVDRASPDFYELIFYGPLSDSYTDRNDYSPIMILYFRGKKIALSGDAEKKAEDEFYSAVVKGEGIFAGLNDSNFYVDVFKAGHHGSKTSTGNNYLSIMTKPFSAANTIAIVSCGINNSYKHPHEELLSRLISNGVDSSNILRTDLNGTIVIAIETVLDESVYKNVVSVGANQSAMIPSIAVNEIVIDWHEICIAIFVCAAILLIVEPLTRSKKKSKKR